MNLRIQWTFYLFAVIKYNLVYANNAIVTSAPFSKLLATPMLFIVLYCT